VTKVLYMEDNDDNVLMLKMRLELLDDFEVLTAEDGERGCEMAAAGAIRSVGSRGYAALDRLERQAWPANAGLRSRFHMP
jgi:CheY-like chemotaxis protein